MSAPEQKAPLAEESTPKLAKRADELGIPEKELREHITSMIARIRSAGVEPVHIGDVLDNAFVAACSKPKEERPAQNDQKGFGRWLRRFAITAAREYIRDRQRSREDLVGEQSIEALVDAARSVHIVEERIDVEVVFHALSPSEGHLLYQHFYQDKEIAEMAEEQGVAWSTMRSRVDRVLDRARIVLEHRSGRRRAGITAFPLVLFGFLVGEARAHVRAFCGRVVGFFRWRPVRFLGGVTGFAAVMGATPPSDPLAMPGDVHANLAGPHSAEIEQVSLRAHGVVDTAPSIRETGASRKGVGNARGNLSPAPARHYEKRSADVIVKANAAEHRDVVDVGELLKRQSVRRP